MYLVIVHLSKTECEKPCHPDTEKEKNQDDGLDFSSTSFQLNCAVEETFFINFF